MSYIYNLADTWDNAGTVFTAIKMNVTDVASNASSALLDLQVGGVSQFKVSKAGAVTAVGVAVPTISSTDTLSNKTLSSPTLSGTVAGNPTFSGVPAFSRTGGHEVAVFNQTNPATYNLDVQWHDNGSVRWIQSVRTNSNDDFWTYNIARTSADISISAASGVVAMVNGATGQSGAAIPTISSTDTLSNKTLSSPTLSGTVAGTPTFSGGVTFPNLTVDANGFARIVHKDGGTPIWSTGLRADNDPSYYIFQESGAGSIILSGSGFTYNNVAVPTISSTDTLSNKTLSGVTMADATDIALATGTGTKIGTSTSQKLGFFNKTPVVQPTAVADATGAGDVVAQLNALLSRMRDLGLIAT